MDKRFWLGGVIAFLFVALTVAFSVYFPNAFAILAAIWTGSCLGWLSTTLGLKLAGWEGSKFDG